jgi:hypothetical protein
MTQVQNKLLTPSDPARGWVAQRFLFFSNFWPLHCCRSQLLVVFMAVEAVWGTSEDWCMSWRVGMLQYRVPPAAMSRALSTTKKVS